MGNNENNKYVINDLDRVILFDDNTVYIRTFKNTHSLKGSNVKRLLTDIFNEFKIPNSIDAVIDNLANTYKPVSVQKMIDFLISNGILKNEIDSIEEELQRQIFMLSEFGKGPKEILNNLNNTKLGIITSHSLIHKTLNILNDVDCFKIINIFDIDKNPNLNVKYDLHECLQDENNVAITKYNDIADLISDSNFIIVIMDSLSSITLDMINKLCIDYEKKWIKVIINGNVSDIGPLIIPGKTACYECEKIRMRNNIDSSDLIIFEDILKNEDNFRYLYINPIEYISISSALLEIIKYLSGIPSDVNGQIINTNYITGNTLKSQVLKVYNCPVCSNKIYTFEDGVDIV